MKNFAKILIIVLVLLALVVGCSTGKEKPKTPEELAEETFMNFEEQAVSVAKEFIIATQGDKEKIKELSFPTLLSDIESKNWSIMLVEEITIDPDTFETTIEKTGENQLFVSISYEVEMKIEDDVIPLELSNKLGILKQDDNVLVFVVE